VAGAELTTSVFCSYPDHVCVYHVSTTSTTLLLELTLGFENTLVEKNLLDVTCGDDYVRLRGVTQAGPPEGLKYDSIARVTRDSHAATRCSEDGSSLSISTRKGQKTVTVVVGAGTNFDQTKGNAEHDYSFKGADPAAYVKKATSAAASKKYEHLLRAHLRDYQALESAFSLNLPDPNGSAEKETADLISAYTADRSTGDPFVEALLFDYSRHLLISSSRPGSLPANLQGRWTEELNPAWSADYHANINLQMNYWAADQTGLGLTQDALWDYMELNWVPRGSETARLLYDADGWVVHNEMNIFGFTAMKEGASWANCKSLDRGGLIKPPTHGRHSCAS
jgi:alpha-L-fucosidase 2